jgi:hypothetical protein
MAIGCRRLPGTITVRNKNVPVRQDKILAEIVARLFLACRKYAIVRLITSATDILPDGCNQRLRGNLASALLKESLNN